MAAILSNPQLFKKALICPCLSPDECFTMLTSNTIHFTKSYLNLMQDLLRVYTPELHGAISQALSEILTMQMKHADRSIRSPDFKKEVR